jgi:hypothetical protein
VLDLSADVEARSSEPAEVVGVERDSSLNMRPGNLEKIVDRTLRSLDRNATSDSDGAK